MSLFMCSCFKLSNFWIGFWYPTYMLPCVYLPSIDISIFCIHVGVCKSMIWCWRLIHTIEMHKTKNNMSCTKCTTNAINNNFLANSEQWINFEYLIFCHTPISLWTFAPTPWRMILLAIPQLLKTKPILVLKP